MNAIVQMFDRIAIRYDLLNHLLSGGIDRRWRKRVVQMVMECNPKHIVDVATGTGDLAIAMARALPHAEILGIDPSKGMLAVAQKKISKRRFEQQIKLVVGTGEDLPAADSEADALTVAFGIRNFANREEGIRQFFRTLRSGGRLYILEFSTPQSKFFGSLYRYYFHHWLPRIGGVVSGDHSAYRYLPASVDDFPAPADFATLLRREGFADVQLVKLMRGVAFIYTGHKI